MTQALSLIIFIFFALVVVGSAAVVVFARNLVHSAFALFFTLLGVAALYAMLGADFLAAAQILIYVGGILVLILFGIMLTNRLYGVDLRTGSYQLVPGVVVFLLLAITLVTLALRTSWQVNPETTYAPSTEGIGRLFLTSYLLPFEVASVLLLAALLGAVMLVRGRPEDEQIEPEDEPRSESTGEAKA
jgi:NADH-quinone oxidoreductase subunit J